MAAAVAPASVVAAPSEASTATVVVAPLASVVVAPASAVMAEVAVAVAAAVVVVAISGKAGRYCTLTASISK
jgi:hypothetical protein